MKGFSSVDLLDSSWTQSTCSIFLRVKVDTSVTHALLLPDAQRKGFQATTGIPRVAFLCFAIDKLGINRQSAFNLYSDQTTSEIMAVTKNFNGPKPQSGAELLYHSAVMTQKLYQHPCPATAVLLFKICLIQSVQNRCTWLWLFALYKGTGWGHGNADISATALLSNLSV